MWKRMTSVEESRPRTQRLRGFFPFVEGAVAEGTYQGAKIKDDGRGIFLVTLSVPSTVSVQDEDSETGQATGQIGETIGVRKTGATKIMREFPIGTRVRLQYVRLTERLGTNPKTGETANHPYHEIVIDVDSDGQESA